MEEEKEFVEWNPKEFDKSLDKEFVEWPEYNSDKFVANYGYMIYVKSGSDPEYPILVRDRVFYELPATKESLMANLQEIKDDYPNEKIFIHPMTKNFITTLLQDMAIEMKTEVEANNKIFTQELFNERLPFVVGNNLHANCADIIIEETELSL